MSTGVVEGAVLSVVKRWYHTVLKIPEMGVALIHGDEPHDEF